MRTFASDEILAYLPQERNALLYSMALGYLGKCQARYDLDARPAEAVLWRIVTSDPDPVRRSQAFRLYRSVAESDEATQRLYRIWKEQVEPADCPLSERDYINLSYTLALRMPDQSDAIVAEQIGCGSMISYPRPSRQTRQGVIVFLRLC